MELQDCLKAISELGKPKEVILEEINMSSTELHNIALGQPCDINGERFTLRFLLCYSFKTKNNNYVINNFKVQIVAKEKGDYYRKELMATKVKVEKVKTKQPTKKETPQIKLEVEENKEDLF
jgi:hypothetical protein